MDGKPDKSTRPSIVGAPKVTPQRGKRKRNDESSDSSGTDTQPSVDSGKSVTRSKEQGKQPSRKRIPRKKPTKAQRLKGFRDVLKNNTSSTVVEESVGSSPKRKAKRRGKTSSVEDGGSVGVRVTYQNVVQEATKHYKNPDNRDHTQGLMMDILKWRHMRTCLVRGDMTLTAVQCMEDAIPQHQVLAYLDSPAYSSVGFSRRCNEVPGDRRVRFLSQCTRNIYTAEVALGLVRDRSEGEGSLSVLLVCCDNLLRTSFFFFCDGPLVSFRSIAFSGLRRGKFWTIRYTSS